MKVLELMHSLEEAYDRFGDIKITIEVIHNGITDSSKWTVKPKELVIESEEFIIKCER